MNNIIKSYISLSQASIALLTCESFGIKIGIVTPDNIEGLPYAVVQSYIYRDVGYSFCYKNNKLVIVAVITPVQQIHNIVCY